MRSAPRIVGISLGLSALPLVLGFGLCGPSDDGPPAPRGCNDAATAMQITALEIGPTALPFVPGDRLGESYGGQGFLMYGYRIAVRATEPVGCISIQNADRYSNVPFNVEVEPDGEWFVTDPLWFVPDGEDRVTVNVDAYGMQIVREMRGPGVSDGSLEDASVSDASVPDGA